MGGWVSGRVRSERGFFQIDDGLSDGAAGRTLPLETFPRLTTPLADAAE